MGSIIRSLEVALPAGKLGMVELSSKAAELCLKNAGIDSVDIGMLISTGVYNESHLREPSIASLVQRQIESGSISTKKDFPGEGSLFSFDLHNGGGGVLSALQVVNGFIQSGKIKHGLVVAADSTPNFGSTENYTYNSGAASILLSGDERAIGFQSFFTDSYPEFLEDFKSIISWKSDAFVFCIQHEEDYLQNCVTCAEKSIGKFLEKEGIQIGDIDLILTSQSPEGFAKQLSEIPGLGDKVFAEKIGHYYSPGLFMTLKEVRDQGVFQENMNILLLTVGAGITVALSHYKS